MNPKHSIDRRQFLRGSGGISLTLPFLPSLLPRQAVAQTGGRKRFFAMRTSNGGVHEASMFPSRSTLTTQQALFADHMIGAGPLQPKREGNDNVLSSVLRAPASELTDAMIKKMNVLWGFDVPFYISHNTGIATGNYAAHVDNANFQTVDPRPSIDQLMAYSPAVYPTLNGVLQRSMIAGNIGGESHETGSLAWNYGNPTEQTGGIQNLSPTSSSLDLFKQVFGTNPVPTVERPRASILDRVNENYRQLRDGNRRLSTLDRSRLDNHVEAINELQRKLASEVKLSCDRTAPTDDSNRHRMFTPEDYEKAGTLMNDVIAAAFACQASNVATRKILGSGEMGQAVSFAEYHALVHNGDEPGNQAMIVTANQMSFRFYFLDLANKLNAFTDADGKTVLDNSLLTWSQESGARTHDSCSIPVVTMGGAGGYFNTGRLVDYRRYGGVIGKFDPYGQPGPNPLYMGLLNSQFLATCLQAMDVPRSAFERWGHRGYGAPFIDVSPGSSPYPRHYGSTGTSRYFQMASDPLPFIVN